MTAHDYSSPSPNQTAGTKAYLEPSEVESLEKCTSSLRDRLLVRLLFHLGCRVSEALALQVQDIDFNQGTVVIQHLKWRIKLSCHICGARLGATHVFCPKCGGRIETSKTEEKQYRRQRVLPIDTDTLKLLKEYVRRGGPIVRDGKKLIFGINRHRTWQIIEECAEKAGLPKLVNPETGKIHNVSPHRLYQA